MKATKKIVGAACALVAATALAAGSTFAWFTSNGTVSAKGMKINVETSNSYLVIGNEAGEVKYKADDPNFAYKKEITLIDASATLIKPSAYQTPTVTGGKVTTTDNTTKAASGTGSIVDVGSWYTAQGTSPTDGTVEVWKAGDTYNDGTTDKVLDATDDASIIGTPKTTKLTDFDGYVVMDAIYVSIAEGSDKVEHVYMTVTADEAWNSTAKVDGQDATANNAISVVILYQQINATNSTLGTWKIAELTEKGNDYGSANHMFTGNKNYLDLGEIALPGDYFQIQVMVYFDGNNEAVRQVNAKNLAGVTLDFNFSDKEPAGGGTSNP